MKRTTHFVFLFSIFRILNVQRGLLIMANQLNQDQGLVDTKRFTAEQRLWIAMKKESNTSTAEIQAQFVVKWPGKRPPFDMKTIWRVWKRLQNHHTVLDLHKGNSGRKRTGRSEENIESVRTLLENQIDKNPDEIVCSLRRNDLNLSQSTFNRITRMDINFHPYRVLRSQKITPHNVQLRLDMGRLLSVESREWYSHLSVSDEAWFSLGGHVFNKVVALQSSGFQRVVKLRVRSWSLLLFTVLVRSLDLYFLSQ